MDIHTSLAKTAKQPFRRWWLLTTFILLAAMGVWIVPHDQQIDAEKLKFATVQSGSIQFSVKGYGRLRSKISREITTAFAAQVETVLHLPGSRVEPDTVILQLTNPELTQQLHRERLVLARQKANVEALRLSQESERLVLKGQNTLLSSELENAKLREQAERQLVTQGIVSSLDHQRSILTVAQLSERVKLAHSNLAKPVHYTSKELRLS